MTGTAVLRLEHLRDMTGSREQWLRGSVTVDQVYAHYQHEHLDFRHPRGGHALYLQRPLMEHFRGWLDDYARTVLRDGGQHAMARSMEHLSDQVEIQAPLEWGHLRRSGHPEVRTAVRHVYDRPPKQHRLTRAEIRYYNRLRHLPPEILGWIWWHVMKKTYPPPRRSRWVTGR